VYILGYAIHLVWIRIRTCICWIRSNRKYRTGGNWRSQSNYNSRHGNHAGELQECWNQR